MAFCTNCGEKLKEDAKFCHKCGTPAFTAQDIANQERNDAAPKAPANSPERENIEARQQPAPGFSEDERTLTEVAANLFKGVEAVGGKLRITTKRLVFQSHSFNVQVGTTEIPLSSIDHLEKEKSLGFINNQMVVVLKDGVRHRFVINNRDNIISMIEHEIRR